MKFGDIVPLAVLGAAVYLWYKLKNPPAPVVNAEKWIANLWVTLTSGPAIQLLGTVQFPDGTETPINQLPIKQDKAGNVYTNVGGTTYQLAPWVNDADGNPVWPATAVGT